MLPLRSARGLVPASLRCRLAERVRQLAHIAAGDADLLEQRIDQGRLGAIAQRAAHDRVGEISPPLVAAGARRATAESIDMQNPDAFDLLQRPDALADDAFDLID